METFKIAVIGLGLIGGSMAMALRGFRDAKIVGFDTDPATCASALKERAVQEIGTDAGAAISGADLVIICTYPDCIPEIIRENRACFKKGAVVTEVGGVKEEIAVKIEACLPDGVFYVGGHPMAGKEVEGFVNACAELFWMTGFIICPVKSSTPESVALVREMAHYIGATRIAVSSPREHDQVIAYTSDLMHVAASALCLDFHPDMNRAYTAGAFRDCTRIAQINPELWCELFLSNGENTVREIDRLVGSLDRIRDAIASRDAETLRGLLTQVRENKIYMQEKEPSDTI